MPISVNTKRISLWLNNVLLWLLHLCRWWWWKEYFQLFTWVIVSSTLTCVSLIRFILAQHENYIIYSDMLFNHSWTHTRCLINAHFYFYIFFSLSKFSRGLKSIRLISFYFFTLRTNKNFCPKWNHFWNFFFLLFLHPVKCLRTLLGVLYLLSKRTENSLSVF